MFVCLLNGCLLLLFDQYEQKQQQYEDNEAAVPISAFDHNVNKTLIQTCLSGRDGSQWSMNITQCNSIGSNLNKKKTNKQTKTERKKMIFFYELFYHQPFYVVYLVM